MGRIGRGRTLWVGFYSLINENIKTMKKLIEKTKKPHICEMCKCAIEVGSPAIRHSTRIPVYANFDENGFPYNQKSVKYATFYEHASTCYENC